MKLKTISAFTCLLIASCEKPVAHQEQTNEEPQSTNAQTIITEDFTEPAVTPTKEVAEPVQLVATNEEETPLQQDSTQSAQQCRTQIQQIDKAARELVRISGHSEGTPFQPEQLKALMTSQPVCPHDGIPYTYTDKVPAEGSSFAKCHHHD